MSRRMMWTISYLITFILFSIYCVTLYILNNQYSPASDQLPTMQAISDYLKKNWEETKKPGMDPPIYIPTGVFIESIKFIDPNTVYATGYFWQKFSKDIPATLKRGVVFSEGSNTKLTQAYTSIDKDIETIGWYFESNFTHGYDYSKYPLDHKIVAARFWPIEFYKNIVLVPDLVSYDSTRPADKFGIDPEYVMQSYSFLETFFNYIPSNYDTNFGIKDFIGKKNFPELHFNIVLKRNMTTVIVTNLIPLCVVLIIFFGTLTIMTSNEIEQKKYGFSLSGILGLCSFMLFVVITAHIRLRETIAGGGIIYLEYIYFIMYFATLYVSLSGFIILKGKDREMLKYLRHEDGLIIKLMFLPLVFLLVDLVTFFALVAE